MIVTIEDVRAAGFCVKGIKYHAETLGLDFKKLLREGYTVQEVEHLKGDAFISKIIKYKEGVA
jgi:molybdate-binding protein